MTNERLKAIVNDYISNNLETTNMDYIKTTLRDVCGCTDDEISELLCGAFLIDDAPDIVQYSIDVSELEGVDDMEKRIKDALEKDGIEVVGIDWQARWTYNGYHNCDTPISCN